MEIFFTDIDGTLLDHNTYEPGPAIEGVELLRREGIPLIPATSKTLDEVLGIMNQLNIKNGFIFESGAGFACPGEDGIYSFKINGAGVDELMEFIPVISDMLHKKIKVLNNIKAEEFDQLTGLGYSRSEMALRRKGSLLFLFSDRDEPGLKEIVNLNKKILSHGIQVTCGGRFFHLTPSCADKGAGVKKIIEFYSEKFQCKPITAAVGDSFNDIAMLKEVDYPYVVRKHDGTWLEADFNPMKMPGTGPEGFTEAVKDFLRKITG